MTPKEKAVELVNKFKNETDGIAGYNYDDVNVQCALIAVDEICEILEDNGLTFIEYHDRTTIEYWLQVKQEIENL
jgi:hypothetical protein